MRILFVGVLMLTLTTAALAQAQSSPYDDFSRSNYNTRAARALQLGQQVFAAGGQIGTIARNQTRIINGDLVRPEDDSWAFTVSLRVNQTHRCGGALISPIIGNKVVEGWRDDDREAAWVVTAAHCVYDLATDPGDPLKPFTTNSMKVESGTTILGSTDAIIQDIDVIIPHPDYNPATLENDIALIKLKRAPIPVDAKRQSIELPDELDRTWLYQDKAAMTVAGWGRTENGALSSILQRVLLPQADHESCQGAFDPYGYDIGQKSVCAGFSTGGYDSCQGDSGGPMYFRPARLLGDPVDRPILVGVVSWGIQCALNGLYGVYTNSLSYRTWIEKQVLKF